MNVEFIVKGISPLLMHNPLMVDPEFQYNREIKVLTSKKKRTDADLKEIERLEWLGGLYQEEVDGRLYITQPTSKIRKCMIGAARISKRGKDVERAISMMVLHTRLIYESQDLPHAEEVERLRTHPTNLFRSRMSVGVNGKRVMRVRPQFNRWALIVPAYFIEDAGLNYEDLAHIIQLAGRAEGIGDGRAIGFGKFLGSVREMTEKTKPIGLTLNDIDKYFEKELAEG